MRGDVLVEFSANGAPENGQSSSPGAGHLNLSRKVSSCLLPWKEKGRLETERDGEAGRRKKRERSRGRHNEDTGLCYSARE